MVKSLLNGWLIQYGRNFCRYWVFSVFLSTSEKLRLLQYNKSQTAPDCVIWGQTNWKQGKLIVYCLDVYMQMVLGYIRAGRWRELCRKCRWCFFYSVLQNGPSRQPTIASCNYCPPLKTEPGTRPGGEWSERSMKGLRVGLSAAGGVSQCGEN